MSCKTLLAVLLVGFAWGDRTQAENPTKPWRYSVGIGAGFESGSGIHLGIARGADMGQLGLGLIYTDQNAEFQYSSGLRYLRTLYSGRINNTYAWAGLALQGHYRKEDRGFFCSEGMGVGASLHFGLPFHLQVDSGWHLLFDSQSTDIPWQWGPTLNGALLYEW